MHSANALIRILVLFIDFSRYFIYKRIKKALSESVNTLWDILCKKISKIFLKIFKYFRLTYPLLRAEWCEKFIYLSQKKEYGFIKKNKVSLTSLSKYRPKSPLYFFLVTVQLLAETFFFPSREKSKDINVNDLF